MSVKVRGREIYIIGIMGKDISAIKVKGIGGGIQCGIEHAKHQKRAVDFSHLAIPKERFFKFV